MFHTMAQARIVKTPSTPGKNSLDFIGIYDRISFVRVCSASETSPYSLSHHFPSHGLEKICEKNGIEEQTLGDTHA